MIFCGLRYNGALDAFLGKKYDLYRAGQVWFVKWHGISTPDGPFPHCRAAYRATLRRIPACEHSTLPSCIRAGQ